MTYQEIEGNAEIDVAEAGGIELLVLDGRMSANGEPLTKGSWMRLPDGSRLTATAGPDGAKVWMKTGHLPFAKAPDVGT